LEIKTYLPLAEKMGIIDGIIDSLIIEDDGIFVLDVRMKELLLTYVVCKYYGQIEFEENEDGIIEFNDTEYDWIQENGVYDYLSTDVDYTFFDIFYKRIEQELEKRNSVGAVLNRFSSKLIEKLNDIGDEEKMKSLMNLTDEALVRYPFIKDIIGNDFKQIKQVKKSGKGKKKVK
jgi:hypothetical protein